MKYFILILLLIAGAASGESAKLTVGLHTLHAKPICNADCGGFKFNTDNELVVLSNEYLLIGKMMNSYYLPSKIYGGKIPIKFKEHNIDISVGLILATNYPDLDSYKWPFIIRHKDNSVSIVAPLLATSYNVNNHLAIEAMTQGSAITFGIGLKL